MAAVPSRELHEAYKEAIAVEIFRGGQCITKWNQDAHKRLLQQSNYEYERSVSHDLGVLGPGDYVVMVSTFDPGKEMDFYMSFYCSKAIAVERLERTHTASLCQHTIADVELSGYHVTKPTNKTRAEHIINQIKYLYMNADGY
eukprot:2191339-Rhodomonas_salina.1